MRKAPLIECQQVAKFYQIGNQRIAALKEINMEVLLGEYIAILGASGSGKSTLMNILGCLDVPSSGTYLLNGKNVSCLTPEQLADIRNKQIGFIFQSFNLLPYMNALDNVALPLTYRRMCLQERKALAQQALEEVNLGNRMQHLPGELSGGQRQRVAIARALVTNPDLLLADEPTGNLDSQSGEEIIHLFEQLVARGKTILMVTHDSYLAKRAKRNIHIKDGYIVVDSAKISRENHSLR